MKMKMKVCLVIALSVAMMLMATAMANAMANTPTKTSIKAVQIPQASTPEKTWTTNGDIRQTQGMPNTGIIRLFIPDTSTTPQHVFAMNNVFNAMTNLDTGHATLRVDAQWVYPAVGTPQGTFEGQIEWNVPNAHGVLQGTGIFEGQTLRFEKDTSQPGIVWIGTLLTR